MSVVNHIKDHDKLGLPAKLSAGLQKKRTIALIGDSWTAAEIPSSALNTAARGVFRTFNSLLGNYFEVLNIAGVGGENLSEIRARFGAGVLAYQPGYCWIQGGLNDIPDGRTAAQMYADTQAMIDMAVEAGITPIVLPCQLAHGGWGTTDAATQTANAKVAALYNRMLSTYALQNPGFIYVSRAWDGVTDQAFTTATYAAYVPTILSVYQLDSSHLNAAGALRAAKDINAQIGGMFFQDGVLPRHETDPASGCWNPMRLASGTPHAGGVTGGAGITGTPCEGWYARVIGTGAATVSQVARTDIPGAYWEQFVCTGFASNASLDYRESDTTAFNYDWHDLSDYDLAVGDVVEFYAELKISDVSDGAAGNGYLNRYSMDVIIATSAGANVSILTANINSGSTGPAYQSSDLDGSVFVISTIRHTIADTSAKWRIALGAYTQNGAAGNTDFTVSFGRVGVRKIA